jgi:hypothetical protein
MSNQQITWKEVVTFISPTGQQQLLDFIRQAREERGKGWLEELKSEFPTFCWIADLVCNKSFDEAYDELKQEFPNYPLYLAKGQLASLHANLKHEIERKR